MAPDVTDIERLTDRPSALSPAAIEQEFARIWRESAAAGVDDSTILLRTMNFVGLGPEKWTIERFERVMESLPQRHPCRGVLAVVSPERHGVDATIAAYCWRTPSGGRHVCSESVVLRAGVEDEHALASTVLALLVPELPLHVWIIGPIDFDSHVTAELIESAQTVFVDTADAADAASSLRAALAVHQQHGVAICDLTWRRIAVWRALAAQFFDGVEGAERLARLEAVEIQGSAGITAEMLLIAGWFVSRLGLSLAAVERDAVSVSATLYDGSRGVTLRLSGNGAGDARISEVKVRASGAEFVVQAHPASGHMHVREEWPDDSDHRTVAQEPTDDASIVAEALDDASDLPIFIEAAQSALSLLRD